MRFDWVGMFDRKYQAVAGFDGDGEDCGRGAGDDSVQLGLGQQ
jgi:hypothetical protein